METAVIVTRSANIRLNAVLTESLHHFPLFNYASTFWIRKVYDNITVIIKHIT